jgi:flagellar motor switch/type III secretory pathway protein FliN
VGLTDLFSKLIVEHGSAEVQAKHIALFKDQLALADKKAALLESENTILKAENEKLKSDFEQSQKENEILRSKIQEYEQPTKQSSHSELLDKVKVDILVALSRQEQTITEQLAGFLNIGVETSRFHLRELSKKKMVIDNIAPDDDGSFRECWELEHEGRRFLVENNLIS